ncbi:MAG: 50S ribosomal protein L33 [Planctomycetota bacterium]|jgi:large subunit ribosomal protein L33
MAKRKKGARDYVALMCPECGNRNYRTSKQLRGTPKLNLSKYCNTCRAHTPHVEKKK